MYKYTPTVYYKYAPTTYSIHITALTPPHKLTGDHTPRVWTVDNPVKFSLSKHIGVDVFFLRDQYSRGTLVPQYVPTEHQLADLFTKSQTRVQHDYLLSKLSVYDPP